MSSPNQLKMNGSNLKHCFQNRRSVHRTGRNVSGKNFQNVHRQRTFTRPNLTSAKATRAARKTFFRIPANTVVRDKIDDDPASKLRRTEAVLFLSREPVASRKLSQLANLQDGTEARTLVKLLNKKYDQHGRAFRVETIAGGFQLMTRPEVAGWLKRIHKRSQVSRLSTPAMETLAVVAYRQPIMRVDVESIRGVSSGEMLRQLMELDLIRISGRSEELGRPFLYSTTGKFLKSFGLNNLNDLPITKSMEQTILTTDPTSDSELSRENPNMSVPQLSNTAETQEEQTSSSPTSMPTMVLEKNLVTANVEDDDDDFDDFEDNDDDEEYESDEDQNEEGDDDDDDDDLDDLDDDDDDDEEDDDLDDDFDDEDDQWHEVESDEDEEEDDDLDDLEDLDGDDDWDDDDDEDDDSWE